MTEFNFIENEERDLMDFCIHNIEARDRLNSIIRWRKEFIRRLKEDGNSNYKICSACNRWRDTIDKLAREKLI